MLDFSVTFIITIINITVLFFILRAILFKPVTKFMAERSQRIQTSFDQAEKDKIRAQKLIEQYESRLKNAEAEAEEIIRNAREQAEKEAEEIIASGKTEAAYIKETAGKKLETEKLAAMTLFKTEAASLVLKAAGRILNRELAGPEQQRYAAQILDQIVMDNENRNV